MPQITHFEGNLERIMMMMNCFCVMVDRRKACNLISSRDHCQRSSPSRISDTPRAGFEPAQSLSSGFVEWSCAVVIKIKSWTFNWKTFQIVYQNIQINITSKNTEDSTQTDQETKNNTQTSFPASKNHLAIIVSENLTTKTTNHPKPPETTQNHVKPSATTHPKLSAAPELTRS